MSMAKEPKLHRLKVRKGFTLGGKDFAKGEAFKAFILGWFVKDGVEIAEMHPEGISKPNGIPAEFFAWDEAA